MEHAVLESIVKFAPYVWRREERATLENTCGISTVRWEVDKRKRRYSGKHLSNFHHKQQQENMLFWKATLEFLPYVAGKEKNTLF